MARGRKWRRVSVRLRPLLEADDAAGAWRLADEELRGSTSAAEEDLLLLLHLSVLAAQYGEERLAASWIDRHQKALRVQDRGAHAALEAIRGTVELASKDYSTLDRRLGAIDWRSVPAASWSANVRLLLAVRANDASTVLDLLRRPSPLLTVEPEFDDPYDRGNRLRILGLHFFGQGRWTKGLGLFLAGLRHFATDRSLDARLKEVEILGAAGVAAYHSGRLDDAESLLERAVRKASRFHHPFYRDKFRHELALVWADREEHDRAEDLCLRVARDARARGSGTGSDHFLQTGAWLAAADVALDRRDERKARRFLAEAARLLDERGHPRYAAHLHLARGRLAALTGASIQVAFDEFDEAERLFRSRGDGDRVGLAKVDLHRAYVHLRARQVREALALALRSAESARSSRFAPVQSRCLLLRSRLLLEQEVPRAEDLYEDVLRDLGVVHSPVTLFKVIANLYLYSWELDDQLDLTDHHLMQIRKMAEVLDRPTFQSLYETHVVRKVARRVVARTLGVDPSAFGEDPV